jgi:hypothetical protein
MPETITGEVVPPPVPPVLPPVPQWRGEVTTNDSGYVDKWYTNALRFTDQPAALEYVHGLAFRWTAVTRWRAVDESVPLDQVYVEGSEDGAW